MSGETRSYGTWGSRVDVYSNGPDADVMDYITTGGSDWYTRMEESGALARIKSEYREAIDRPLPPDVSLCGNEFIGPDHPEEGEFDGYPADDFGSLNFKAMIRSVDLDAIVERNDPDLKKENN